MCCDTLVPGDCVGMQIEMSLEFVRMDFSPNEGKVFQQTG